MRHTGGWIKLHRKIEHSWVANDVIALALWDTLLRWAHHNDSKIKLAGNITKIKAGQLVTGASELARKFNLDRRTVTRRLNLFEESEMIDQQVTNKGRVITIINWESYQSNSCNSDQLMPNTMPNTMPNQVPLSGEDKKIRSKEVKNIYIPFDLDIATRWINWAISEGKIGEKDSNLESCADVIRKLRTIDKIPEQKISEIFEFVKTDDFWSKAALSPSGLRKKSKNNDLPKYRNIMTAMERPNGKGRPTKKCATTFERDFDADDEIAQMERNVDEQRRQNERHS